MSLNLLSHFYLHIQNEFVNKNAADLKDGYPSEELIEKMKEGMYEV